MFTHIIYLTNTKYDMSLLITSIISAFLVGIVNSLKDLSSIDFFSKKWWNKSNSWKNKWKLDKDDNIILNEKKYWYYLYYFTPKYKERFIYSSTIFVSLTDGWHLLQKIQFTIVYLNVALLISTSILQFILYFLLVYTVFTLTFSIFYTTIQKINK